MNYCKHGAFMNMKITHLLGALLLFLFSTYCACAAAGYRDTPFPQKVTHKYTREDGLPAGGATDLKYCGGELYAATPAGVYVLDGEKWRKVVLPGNTTGAAALACSGGGLEAAESPLAAFRIENPGLLDGIGGGECKHASAARAAAVDDGGFVYLATAGGVCRAAAGGEWELIDGADGLPYEDVTSVAARGGTLVAGTSIGAARLSGGGWEYFQSGRYLPDDRVNAVALGPDGSPWFATPGGISRIEYRMMTLEQKSEFYQERAGLFGRHGFIGDMPLREKGDLSTIYPKTHDNENVWTGMYIAAECYRYGATGDEEARKRARRSLDMLLLLEEVTGVPGLFARSVSKPGDSDRKGGEWHPSADGEWLWEGDTSSDEVAGRFYGFSVYYDVCGGEGEKELIRNSVRRTMDYIIDNDYYLMDVDGEPTMWGKWNPEFFRTAGRLQKNLNSLEILSFLKTAQHMTGERRFFDAYAELIKKHGYAHNAIYSKFEHPSIQNHSDDLLAFLSYYPLLKYEKHPKLREKYFLRSIRRTWNVISDTRNPLWNFIYGAAAPDGEDFGLEDAVYSLRKMPMDLVYWEVRNSHRADIEISPFNTARKGEQLSVAPLPPDERFMLKYNENPYRLDGFWKGMNAEAPTFWLLPYWMGRYYGFIE